MNSFDPTIRTQADLQAAWTALVRPSGFSDVRLWFFPIGPDGRAIKHLTQIDELPADPPPSFAPLMDLISATYADDVEVAFLLCRPGSAQLTRTDITWAKRLLEASLSAGLGSWAVHVATDTAIVVVPPDEVSAA